METVAWVLCGALLAAFLTLWFRVAHRELARAKRELDGAARQVALHTAVLAQARDGPSAAAAGKALGTNKRIYERAAAEYNALLTTPQNRIPARVLGFRPAPQIPPDMAECKTGTREKNAVETAQQRKEWEQ